MIEPVEHAINRAYIFYAVSFAILISVSVACFIAAKKKDSMLIFGIALALTTIICFVTVFLPFYKDCTNSNITVTKCVYINSVGDKSKKPSSALGIYSVKLITEEDTLKVTTIPISDFPAGEYTVRAYYTTNSKCLIYIEILE